MTRGINPVAGRSVPWLLDMQARRRSDHPFLVWEPFEGEPATWTYAQFARDVESLATGIQHRGIGAGDRLILHADNSPEFLLTWFACARIGATAVCTNTKSSEAELRYFAEHASVVAAISQPAYRETIEAALPGGKWVAVSGEPQPGQTSFDSLFDDPDVSGPAIDPSGAASIQYTSGTTARPKAVVWSHANVLFGAKASAAHEGLTQDDVHHIHLPLFHTNAQMYSMLATLWAGGTVVLQPRFSASRFWDVAVRRGCTWSSVVPFVAQALVSLGEPPPNSFRLWGSGVSQPPEDQLLGVTSMGWFGMTETVSHCVVDDPQFPGPSMAMGRPAAEYAIRIVDVNGQLTNIDEPGHLQVLGVRGVSLFAEYLNDPDATGEAFTDDGWFKTGDLAIRHAAGHLTFGGRIKDMLKVGGENVAEADVEAVILGVDGVREVAVVGRPHPMLGEVPVAFVIATSRTGEMAAEILSQCRTQLSSFKVPREVRIVDELPRSTLNKVAKGTLRTMLADEADVSNQASLKSIGL
jgi:carnitine-CoA ligase